jgi:hypothetical protein
LTDEKVDNSQPNHIPERHATGSSSGAKIVYRALVEL